MRCRTEDGPTEEEIKRIARTCVRSISDAESDYYSDDRNSSNNDEDENSEEDNNDGFGRDRTRNQHRVRPKNRFKRFIRGSTEFHFDGRSDANRQPYNGHRNQSNFGHQNRDKKSNSTSDHDQSCMTHCFFREFKMVGSAAYDRSHS